MAGIKGFQLKNVKNTMGMEGYGCTATMYLNGKKIGTYADYGDGSCEDVHYVNKEAEQAMTQLIIEYAKINQNDFVINIYKERPEQFKEECERFKKYYPYIPDEDITMQTMASNSIVYIVEDLLTLIEYEKYFKKQTKKGYGAIGIKDNQIVSFPKSYTYEQIKSYGCTDIYMDLQDFNVM